jgi:hypothetical protein
VIVGSISPGVCNAACDTGGKLIKAVEMHNECGGSEGQGEFDYLSLVLYQELLANTRP